MSCKTLLFFLKFFLVQNWNEMILLIRREKGIEFIIFFLLLVKSFWRREEEIADHVKYIWKGTQHKRVVANKDAQSNVIGRPKRYYACKVEILMIEYNVESSKLNKIGTKTNKNYKFFDFTIYSIFHTLYEYIYVWYEHNIV